ncbi:6-phosphofructokinase [Eisenibacter elegans]|uniref:6-phosphofructokinase n=1 Tax=Eisenibacter elegans TaxID=997 RepID=UPI00041BB0DF|nr:6-phosphofructokinase [Eisenibacter elegans]
MKKIAVFTSGGDSPGMNACVRAVVRAAIAQQIEVFGIIRGYDGMIRQDIIPLQSPSVSNIIQRGGTILKSARSKDFMTYEGRKKAFESLQAKGIEGIVAIGGDGTFKGAQVFFEEFGIPTVGCPGTIDNDLYGTDYTIGFDTAINTALEAIDKIRDTADSHDRVFFIEVMGRDAGYIAIQSGIAGGAELVLVPETETKIEHIIHTLEQGKARNKTSEIIVVAEGDEAGDATTIAAQVKEKLPHLDIRVSVLGHIQRGGSPTARDRILASRLGIAAVQGLVEGRSNVMAGIINDELVYTSFHDTIHKAKPIKAELLQLIDILSL